MRKWAELVFVGSLVVFLSTGVIQAQKWPFEAKLFPLAIGYPMLVLAVLVFIRTAWKMKANNVQAESLYAQQPSGEVLLEVATLRAIIMLAWFALSGFLIWTLGLRVGIPMWIFLFLYFQSKETLWFSALLAVAAGIFMVGFFDKVVHIPWPKAQLSALPGFESVEMVGVVAAFISILVVVSVRVYNIKVGSLRSKSR